MNIVPAGLVRRVERQANRLRLPLSWNLRLGLFVRRTLQGARRDHLSAYAGHLAFRALFAIFPSLISLLWLLKVFHATGLVNTFLNLTSTAMPKAASTVIRQQVSSVPHGHATSSLTFGALLSLIVSIWALSVTFRATMEAMNVIYAVQEDRPVWKQYCISLLLALTLGVLLVASLLLIVFGSEIATKIDQATGLGSVFRVAWNIVAWPSLVTFVLSAFALAYYFAPDVRQRFRWIRIGSVIAVLLWLLYTVLYSLYINDIVNYDETYGALAGIAILMVYLYGVSFLLLLGAEMNQVIELNHPEGKNEGEKVPEGEKVGDVG